MTRPTVCFLTIDSVSEGVGRSQILPVLREVEARGWDVHLVALDKSLDERIHPRTNVLFERSRFTALPFGGKGVGPGAWRLARLARAIPRADVYHCRSDIPYLAATLGRHRPRIWDCRSLWAEQRAASGSLQRNSPAFWTLTQVERRACIGADGLITLSHAAASSLSARWGRLPPHRTVIPTVTDLNHFRVSSIPPLTLIRACLSGTFGRNYDLDIALRFLLALQEAMPKTSSLEALWTSGPEGRISSGLGWPVHTTHQITDYTQLPDVISSCHFGMVPIRLDTGVSSSAMMPTKVGEFLASGRPIVVTRGVGDLDQLIEGQQVGVVIRSDDVKEIERAAHRLMVLLQDPQVAYRCRRVSELHFSLKDGVSKLVELYAEVI